MLCMLMDMQETRLAVPGLRNIGNTCFAAAVLQALASCTSLLRQLHLASQLQGLGPFSTALLDILERLQPSGAAATLASESLAEVLHALRQCVGRGVLPVGEECDVVEAYEAIMGLVACELQRAFARRKPQLEAQGGLAAVLRPPVPPPAPALTCQLQQQGTTVVPCWPAEQEGAGGMDAAERGGACLANCCRHLADSPYASIPDSMCSIALAPAGVPVQGQSTAGEAIRSSSSSIAPGTAAVAAAEISSGARCRDAGIESPADAEALQCNGGRHPADAGTNGGLCLGPGSRGKEGQSSSSSSLEREDDQPERGAPWAYVDSVLSTWQGTSRPVCEGSLASELQCLRCHHRFASQVAPFLALPLSIPLAPGRTLLGHVPAAPGASLGQCLHSFFGYEVLPGVACTRCSLQASLAAAQEADGVPPALESLQRAVQQRVTMLESDSYEEAMRSAGLEWVVCRSHVAKRQLAARLPMVLCLQLRRAFWAEAGEVKVAGHVRFPLSLRLDTRTGVPRLGQTAMPSPAAQQAQQGADVLDQASWCRPYWLRAVLVHYGGSASGHYVVYRCLDAMQQQWARVSDEAVELGVPCCEVLSAEATALFYERH